MAGEGEEDGGDAGDAGDAGDVIDAADGVGIETLASFKALELNLELGPMFFCFYCWVSEVGRRWRRQRLLW